MASFYQLVFKKPKTYFIKLPQKEDNFYFDIIWPLGFVYSRNFKEFSYKHLMEHLISTLVKEKISSKDIFKGFVSDEDIHFSCVLNKENINLLPSILKAIFSSSLSDFQKYFDREKKLVEDEEIKKQNDFYSRIKDIAIKAVLDKKCLYYKCFLNKPLSYKFGAKELFNYYQKFIINEPIFFIGGNQLPKYFVNILTDFYRLKTFISHDALNRVLPCKIKSGLRKTIRLKKEYQFKGACVFIILGAPANFQERVAFNFLSDILFHSQNKTDLNFYEFLFKRGFYNIRRDFVNYKSFSLLLISINTNEKRIKELILALKEFFEQLSKNKINNQIVLTIKKLFLDYYKNDFSTNQRYEILIGHLLNYRKYRDIIPVIQKLNSDNLQKLTQDYLSFQKLNIIVER